MDFQFINVNQWKRKEWFEYYLNQVPCRFDLTTRLDITELSCWRKEKNLKLYPILLYGLSKVIERHPEFRMDFHSNGQLICWEELQPAYTVFNERDQLFRVVTSSANGDFIDFYQEYLTTLERNLSKKSLFPQIKIPANHFSVSMIPWCSFTSFHVHSPIENDLKPIFTFGKYQMIDHRRYIPIAVQVHHAVCDGYHVGKFMKELQKLLSNPQFFDTDDSRM